MFTILAHTGNGWTGWAALLLQPLLALPFFELAWLSRIWPRNTGALLVGASVFFVQFFGLFRNDPLALVNLAVVLVLFIGPILASGIALLGAWDTRSALPEDPEDSEED